MSMEATRRGIRSAQVGMLVNTVLAMTKLIAGLVGNSYALVADAVESTADVLSSLIVWSGLQVAGRSPDERHPFGYGKAESLATAVVALMLLGAAIGISIQAIGEIRTPHHTPAPWTLASSWRSSSSRPCSRDACTTSAPPSAARPSRPTRGIT